MYRVWPPRRYQFAKKALRYEDIRLPELLYWRDDQSLLNYQKKGVAWMFGAKKGLLADQVGLGKTIQSLALACLVRERNVNLDPRILVVTPKSAQLQWAKETAKFTKLRVGVAQGSRSERASQYMALSWDILITTYPLLLRDLDYLREINPELLILDEASVFRNQQTQTHKAVRELTKDVSRVVLLDATPIQTSLTDIHGVLAPLELDIFGSLASFDRNYVRRIPIKVQRGRRVITANKIVGYQNMEKFKKRVEPFILRRRASEVDVALPEVVADTVWLELPKKQRKAYEGARESVRTMFDSGARRQARASFHLLQQACDTTRHFDDSNPESVKIDWLLRQLTGGGIDTCVVFAHYLETVAHVMDRLKAEGVGAVRYTGVESSDEEREKIKDAFWNDPSVRVLVGTSALERTLNLQKTSHLVCINQLWNPQRMTQIVGRIRRIGSEHAHAFVVNLMTRNTIEERLGNLQAERAAVSDWVFGDTDSMFEKLSDEQLMELISV